MFQIFDFSHQYYGLKRSRSSSVGIATNYGLAGSDSVPDSEVIHSPSSSAKVEKDGAIPPLPLCLYGIVLN
jgi:hypothetical protein